MNKTTRDGMNLSKKINPRSMLSGTDLEYFSKQINSATMFVINQKITDLYYCGIASGYDLARIEDGSGLEISEDDWRKKSIRGNGIYHSRLKDCFQFWSADLNQDISKIKQATEKKEPLSDLIMELYYRGIMDGYKIYKSRKKRTATNQDNKQTALSAMPCYNFSIDYSRRH